MTVVLSEMGVQAGIRSFIQPVVLLSVSSCLIRVCVWSSLEMNKAECFCNHGGFYISERVLPL